MRLEEHPVLDFDRGEEVVFYYNGQPITGFTHENHRRRPACGWHPHTGTQSPSAPSKRSFLCHRQLFLLFHDCRR